jgi:formylglycine-generating enzyme required for sulfatase activity
MGYTGAPTDGSAWVTGGTPKRIMRGGSWYFPAALSRSAARSSAWPDNRYNSYGLRLVVAVTSQ